MIRLAPTLEKSLLLYTSFYYRRIPSRFTDQNYIKGKLSAQLDSRVSYGPLTLKRIWSSNVRSMTTVTTVKESEYDEWAEIWRQYLEFYETTLPQDQYKNTWSRIHKPDGDIRALVARDDQGKIIGLSHYLFLSSPWSAAPLCLLNGRSIRLLASIKVC